MKQQGIPVVVADPHNPQAAVRQLDQFFKQSLDAGKNPMIFSDINKVVPSQLGNQKAEALDAPAQILAQATKGFYDEVNRRGGVPLSTYAAHSDGTKVEIRAAILAERLGAPVTRAFVESPRQEAEVEWGLRRAPNTHFTVVQPSRGDLLTSEAQGRFVRGKPGAYSQTIEKLKSIKDSNYELALITNPSQSSPSLLHPAGAHGDSANLNRFSQVEFYQGGKQIDNRSGFLGQLLSEISREMPQERLERNSAKQPGGILLGSVHLARGAGGRVVFESGNRQGEELVLVYTLFNSDATSQ